VQHGAEHEAGASPLGVDPHRLLRRDDVGDHLRQRAVVTDAAGEHERRPGLDQRVHQAAGEHALIDGGRDTAAAPDGVDGAQVVLVTAGHGRARLEVDAQRRTEEGRLDVVGRHGVAAEDGADVARLDEAGKARRRPRVHHGRTDHGDRELALLLHVP